MQLPVGMLLDRYGPRRVEPVLLAHRRARRRAVRLRRTPLPGLTVARALIGAGVCACLMAPLKAIAAWYPPDRQASYSGWIMVAGGIGALAATVPVELALRVATGERCSWSSRVMTLAVALVICLARARHRQAGAARELRGAGRGRARRVPHPRFWWIAPLGALAQGSFMAIQGLWAVPWMMEVEGMSRAHGRRLSPRR